MRAWVGRLFRAGVLIAICAGAAGASSGQMASRDVASTTTWTADNGNGTFTNPLFNDEFSDPDIIRVGSDYYMTGTTMHAMPGLPVLRSRDLVNWTLVGYAVDRLDLGPEYRMEDGKEAYGNGIWAPAIRYHNGTFYIFANVNGHGTQVFRASHPAGPWTRNALGKSLHDVSVLFDDDGRVWAVYEYGEVHLIELKPDLSGVIEGSDRVIIPRGSGVGEGHHLYKIDGKYIIISADYAPVGRMTAARADRIDGRYEIVNISHRETMGTTRGWFAPDVRNRPVPVPGEPVRVTPPDGNSFGAAPLHQGGIVELPNGDWWGWSMMDVRSMGRTTFLSPVTWEDGWPYFGLPGNLGRSPRTWLKPDTGVSDRPTPTYRRNDDFAGPGLQPVWQWNHVPDDTRWSLAERRGALRLHTLPAPHLLLARNSLTQRVVAPQSIATAVLNARGLRDGDVAGLALLSIPYSYVGVAREGGRTSLRFYDALTNTTVERPLPDGRAYLRVDGDFEGETARFAYSVDGKRFEPIGEAVRQAYQLKTFQGVRFTLFAFNAKDTRGGYADFEDFRVEEPFADRSRNVPTGRIITIRNLADERLAWANPHGMLHFAAPDGTAAQGKGVQFRIHGRGKGRVALEAMNGSGFLTVVGRGLSADVRLMKTESAGSLFQWQDMLRRQFMLLSLRTNRYLGLDPLTGEPYSADWPGTRPDRKDGTVLVWEEVRDAGLPTVRRGESAAPALRDR